MKNIYTKILLIICMFLSVFLIVVTMKTVKYKNELNEIYNKSDSIEEYEKFINNEYAVKIPVIVYHKIVDHETKIKEYKNNEWANDLDEVEKQLKYLYDNGWKSIDLDEFYSWYMKEKDLDPKTFVLTIDDGDIEVYNNLLPLLEKYNFKATSFLIGSTIEDESGYKIGLDIINKLREEKSLLQFESHTYELHDFNNNGDPIASTSSIVDIKEDFDKNSRFNFKYLAYPYGYYNNDFLMVVSNRKDIKMAFSFYNTNYATRSDNLYAINRIMITGNTSFEDFKKWFNNIED